MPVIAIPLVVEGVVVGGAWAYRAYRVYRLVKAAQALDEMAQAQEAAKPNDKAEEKTASQAKADATTSADCKNCGEDPECEKAREKLKKALYDRKGNPKEGIVGNSDVRGLAERLCHYLFGNDPAQNATHQQAVGDWVSHVKSLADALSGKGPPHVTSDERARMKKDERKAIPDKRLKNCDFPEDLKKDMDDLMKFAEEVKDGKASISPMPRSDFSVACTANAAKMVLDVLRK